MATRLARALAPILLALGVLSVAPAAAADAAPVVGTARITATSAASVQVSVPVDSQGNLTTVKVEYATAGAYRPGHAKVPSASTTVTIATTPASDTGPVTVTGQVTGLKPGSTYRMRVKASNVRGETISADVTVRTPGAPRAAFRAKVGKNTTKVTKLSVTGATGVEAARVTCRPSAKGCPLASTVIPLAAGKTSMSRLLKGFPLVPGAKVRVVVSAYGVKLSTLALVIRDDQQPTVRRR